ncbi:Domain of uncharacterised function (DUF2825) [Klebsiella pneumoniae]|nr:Domain of uncharacterised function (DUF2825) [Klebsiella pneumoniae]
MARASSVISVGLSPLARGTRRCHCRRRRDARFITAGAGNISEGRSCLDSQTVYPRWREEHPIIFCHTPDAAGLSSLARGTLQLDARMNLLTRFIPAGAGNTCIIFPHSVIFPVYPRWRGEHSGQTIGCPSRRGLSPLARGTLTVDFHTYWQVRFIPAGAGNTEFQSVSKRRYSVYPRWRGEHAIRAALPGVLDGLSPLARGTRR